MYLMCLAMGYLATMVWSSKPQFVTDGGYDTIHVYKPKIYDTIRSYPVISSQTSRRVYSKIDSNRILEEDAITFDYLYDCHKTPGCGEIGNKIPRDTTIKWLSKNKDTVFYLTLKK